MQATLETPLEIAGVVVDVGASLGVAVAPGDGDDATTLLQRADVAMYVAKADHRDIVFYEPEADPYSPQRLSLAADLRRAVAAGDVEPHFQPVTSLVSGVPTSVEALARWTHPTFGVVPPDVFIPIAEQSGLIRELTFHMLDRSLEHVRKWRSAGFQLRVAVNLSVRLLSDDNLVERIARHLDRAGVDAVSLTLEVTEGTIMADPNRAIAVLPNFMFPPYAATISCHTPSSSRWAVPSESNSSSSPSVPGAASMARSTSRRARSSTSWRRTPRCASTAGAQSVEMISAPSCFRPPSPTKVRSRISDRLVLRYSTCVDSSVRMYETRRAASPSPAHRLGSPSTASAHRKMWNAVISMSRRPTMRSSSASTSKEMSSGSLRLAIAVAAERREVDGSLRLLHPEPNEHQLGLVGGDGVLERDVTSGEPHLAVAGLLAEPASSRACASIRPDPR